MTKRSICLGASLSWVKGRPEGFFARSPLIPQLQTLCCSVASVEMGQQRKSALFDHLVGQRK
jgi:hypothetical protein